MTDDKERSGGGFLLRQPFALLGAVALLSLAQDLLTWQENINTWLNAFQAVTRPIWDFLLGWFFEWVGWEFPCRVKDYLTVGVVMSGMSLRTRIYSMGRPSLMWACSESLLVTFLWPILLLVMIRISLVRNDALIGVFWEAGIWVLIIIAVNYALLYGGA